jgi:hypothetical protein
MTDPKIRMCVDVLSPVPLRERHCAASELALGNATATRAIAPIRSIWPNGTERHVSFLGGTDQEHQNPDGGLKWNESVVLKELAGPPNSWDEATIRFNVLDKYQVNQLLGTKFDPDSIMLYAFPARWTTNGVSTKENSAISKADQDFVGSKAMYPFPAGGGSGAVVLTVSENSGVDGEIAKPGEVDLYQFTAQTAGLFTIVTEGATDVFMRLFGPNNDATFIAEDDDSAGNSNARIIRQLAAGDYFVQIRHYSPTQTGKYRVNVSR